MQNLQAGTTISPERIRQVVEFHGHMCPGVAIGVRAAEYALQTFWPLALDSDLTAVVETETCAVDAIQMLLGCTFGRGTLVHLDYGKNAFSFYHREGKAARIVAKPTAFGPPNPERIEGFRKMREGTMTQDEHTRFWEIQKTISNFVLTQPFEQLFSFTEVNDPMPRRVRMASTVVCERCQEPTMETRIQFFEGKKYCVRCYETLTLKPLVFAKVKAIC